jgi:hypothetical protein
MEETKKDSNPEAGGAEEAVVEPPRDSENKLTKKTYKKVVL